jgi:hypothetical protein
VQNQGSQGRFIQELHVLIRQPELATPLQGSSPRAAADLWYVPCVRQSNLRHYFTGLAGFQSEQCRRGGHAHLTYTPGLVFQILQMNRHITGTIIRNMMPFCRHAECEGVLPIDGPGPAFRRQDHLVNETDPLGITGA